MTCGPSGIEGFDSLSPTIDKQSDAMRERYVEPQKGGTYTKHEHQALVLLRENKLMSKFQYPSKTKASFFKKNAPGTISSQKHLQKYNNQRNLQTIVGKFLFFNPLFANVGRLNDKLARNNV